jgi:C1A family cysteine protease
MAIPNFEKLNKAIRDAGATWVAGETPLSALHGRKLNSKYMGLALTPEIAFGALSEKRSEEISSRKQVVKIPPMIDWRNHDGRSWITSVKNQKSCGACVAFASIAVIESRIRIKLTDASRAIDLSEAHLFNCGAPNSCDVGWQPGSAMSFASNTGVGLERDFPYQPKNMPCKAIPIVAKVVRPNSAATSRTRKTALLAGPVVASMAVYDDFFSYKSGVYRHVVGNLAGYHAVCVVGYDDVAGCWIAKNSWDVGWGESGFFRIRYGECGFDSQFSFNFPSDINIISLGTSIVGV